MPQTRHLDVTAPLGEVGACSFGRCDEDDGELRGKEEQKTHRRGVH
jgi:hypothetical protein